jgi:hypothetical protein
LRRDAAMRRHEDRARHDRRASSLRSYMHVRGVVLCHVCVLGEEMLL